MLLSAEGADCSEVMVVAPSSELDRLSGQAMEAAPPCRPRHVDAWQPPLTPPPLRALGSTSRKRKLSPQVGAVEARGARGRGGCIAGMRKRNLSVSQQTMPMYSTFLLGICSNLKAERAISALNSMGSPATSSPFQETIKQESLVDKVQALQLDIRAEKQSFEALSIQASKPATEIPSGCGGRASLELPDAPTRTLDAPGGSGLDVFELAREASAELRAWMER